MIIVEIPVLGTLPAPITLWKILTVVAKGYCLYYGLWMRPGLQTFSRESSPRVLSPLLLVAEGRLTRS